MEVGKNENNLNNTNIKKHIRRREQNIYERKQSKASDKDGWKHLLDIINKEIYRKITETLAKVQQQSDQTKTKQTNKNIWNSEHP